MVERFEFAAEGLPQLLHGMEEPIAEAVFEHIPELFDGIEFRAVTRQLDDMNPIRQGVGAALLVEPGSVPDDDVFGRGILWARCFKKASLTSRAA